MDLPYNASETFDSEAPLCPFTTGRSRSVKCAKPGVNSALVGFGAQLVVGAADLAPIGIDTTVLPIADS